MKGSKASLAVLPSEIIWLCRMYLESTHEIGRVGSFVRGHTGKVVDLIGFVLGMRKELFELSDVLPGFSEIERAKVLIEAVIEQILAERMNTLSILK